MIAAEAVQASDSYREEPVTAPSASLPESYNLLRGQLWDLYFKFLKFSNNYTGRIHNLT